MRQVIQLSRQSHFIGVLEQRADCIGHNLQRRQPLLAVNDVPGNQPPALNFLGLENYCAKEVSGLAVRLRDSDLRNPSDVVP